MNVRVHVGLQLDNEYVDDNNLLALRHHLPHEHCRSSLAPLCSSCKTWPAKLVRAPSTPPSPRPVDLSTCGSAQNRPNISFRSGQASGCFLADSRGPKMVQGSIEGWHSPKQRSPHSIALGSLGQAGGGWRPWRRRFRAQRSRRGWCAIRHTHHPAVAHQDQRVRLVLLLSLLHSRVTQDISGGKCRRPAADDVSNLLA